MIEYKLTPIEVASGKGKGEAEKLNTSIQALMQTMGADGWRLVSTESEVYVGRTTWIRLFWERQQN